MGTCKSSYPKHLPFSYLIAFHAIHLIIHHWVLFSFSFIHFFPCFHFSNLSLLLSFHSFHFLFQTTQSLFSQGNVILYFGYHLIPVSLVISCNLLWSILPVLLNPFHLKTNKQTKYALSLTKIFNLKFTIFIFHNKCNYHVCYNVMREISLRIIFAAKVRLFKTMN